MTGKILVTGAPGNVGTEVVKGLLQHGTSFCVGAWDAQAAKDEFGSGVDVRHFDFLKPSTYAHTFDGVRSMFLVRPPALSNVQRDIAPALRAAVDAGVDHIVFLSLQGVEKNRVVPHYKIENFILALGVKHTFLRASFFMQNLSTTHAAEIRNDGEIRIPVGRARTSFIDVRDIAAVAVRALLDDSLANKSYTLTGGEALDYYDVARIMSNVLRRPIHYTNPSIIAFLLHQRAQRRPLTMALIMAGLYTITRFGNAAEATSTVYELLGRMPISFEQFVRDYAGCWQSPALPSAPYSVMLPLENR